MWTRRARGKQQVHILSLASTRRNADLLVGSEVGSLELPHSRVATPRRGTTWERTAGRGRAREDSTSQERFTHTVEFKTCGQAPLALTPSANQRTSSAPNTQRAVAMGGGDEEYANEEVEERLINEEYKVGVAQQRRVCRVCAGAPPHQPTPYMRTCRCCRCRSGRRTRPSSMVSGWGVVEPWA